MADEPLLRFAVEEKCRHSHVIRIQLQSRSDEQWFLLSSDRHHDNVFCNQKLEMEHLKEAVERKAGILDAGDLHCAMQGKWDKRADRSQMREEYQQGHYLDALVNHAVDFYSPFAGNWVLMIPGNHESKVWERHETNLTERTVEAMKQRGASNLHLGSYAGWVKFIGVRGKNSSSINMHYHHGYGGGGAVTRDMIQTNRKAVYLPDAHICWSGHTHDALKVPIARERYNDNGTVSYDEQVHVKTPGYKNAHVQHAGWETERGMAPKPIGACWLRVFWKGDILDFELREAK